MNNRPSSVLVFLCRICLILAATLLLPPAARAAACDTNGPGGTSTCTCSSWVNNAWLNEYFFGQNSFLEIYSKNASFPAAWQGWTIDVYDGVDHKMLPTVTLNNSTAFACTKTGNKTWVTHDIPGSDLSGGRGLAVLRDANGHYVDAFAFDNTVPPVPWQSSTTNYLPALATACTTLRDKLNNQLGSLATNPNQANILIWSNQGNKDYSRMPDGANSPWYVTSEQGAGTTYTTCTSNNANMTKSVNVTTAPQGGTVKFTITMANASTSAITGTLYIVDTLPPGLTLVSVASSNANDIDGVAITYSADGVNYSSTVPSNVAYVKWAPTDLSGSSRAVLTIAMSVPGNAVVGTTYTNTASTGGTALTSQQNDSASFAVVASTTPSFQISPSTQTSCVGADSSQIPVITIRAKDQINGTGNTITGYRGTVTLGTSSVTNTATWSKYAANGSLTLTASGATYAFTAADNGEAKFTLSSSVAQSIDITATDPNTYSPDVMSGVFSAITYASTCSAAVPSLSIQDASIAEGNSATRDLNFTVTRTGSTTAAISVQYATSNVTATAGTDYVSTSGTLNFAAGETSKTISVPINGDTDYEGDETFTVDLSNPSGANLAVASATGTVLNDDSPTLLAQYLMDDTSWNGSGSVKDTAGNSIIYNGTAVGAAAATSTGISPAYLSGGQGTCGYGTFSASPSATYIALPAGFPSLPSGTGFTVTAWVRPALGATEQRLVSANDSGSSNDYSWALSILSGGNTRLFKKGITFSAASSGSSISSANGVSLLTSTFAMTTNSWYFVAMTVDTSGKTVTMYVYDAAGTQQSRVTASYTGTWYATGSGAATLIGGDSASATYNFTGLMDEVRFYNGALPQSYVETVRTLARACTSLHHLEIQGSATGVTCLPSTLTIVACQDSGCTSTYTGGISGTLTATPPNGAATPTVTWQDGSASFAISSGSSSVTKQFWASSAGSLDISTASLNPAAANASTCNFGNPLCRYSAADVGFIISAAADGAETTIPTEIAGVGSATYYLRAVKTNDKTKACEAALTGQPTTVDFAYECKNPANCYSSDLMSVNGGSSTVVSRNNSGSVSTYQSVSMTFDANGNAPFTVNYSDVGQVTLWVRKLADGIVKANLAGSSNAFVVRPYSLVLTDIKQTATPNLANPAAGSASGAKFIAAGEAFSATVTAVNQSCSANLGNYTLLAQIPSSCIAASYGSESTPEGVTLSAALASGLGFANNPGINNPGAFGSFVSNGAKTGSATGTNFSWDEVGIINLTPEVGDGNYLGTGSGVVIPTQSGNIGRFYAHHFGVTGSLRNRSDLTNSGSAFTYMDEPMRLTLTVTAYGKNGETALKNYAGSFAKLDAASLGSGIANWTCTAGSQCMGLGAVGGSTNMTGRLSIDTAPANGSGSPSSSWSDGVGTFTLYTIFSRNGAPDGPYKILKIGAKPLDSDGVTLPLLNSADSAHCADLDITTGSESSNCVISGSTEANVRRKAVTGDLRYGKLTVANASGSERQSLPVPVSTWYYNGTSVGWVVNTDDSLTSLPLAPFTGNASNTTSNACYTAGCSSNQGGDTNSIWLHDIGSTLLAMAAAPTNASTLASGKGTITLGKPTISGTATPGTVEFTLVTPPWLRTNSGKHPGTGAACASTSYACNPTGRISFGVYSRGGSAAGTKFIYIRENY